MTESIWAGIAGIVAIVVVTALFLSAQPGITGQATSELDANAQQCEPARFCDGSRLVMIRSDCSVAESFCQRGCNREQLVCN